MTFQLLSYSVLHQPRYDNTHMFVIPSKVKHNNSMRGSINFQLKKVNKYLKLISCTIENEILNITNMILVSILFLYIYIYIYVYIYIFLTKKFMVPRLILNTFPILFLPDAELPSLEEINSITKGLPKKIKAAREKQSQIFDFVWLSRQT